MFEVMEDKMSERAVCSSPLFSYLTKCGRALSEALQNPLIPLTASLNSKSQYVQDAVNAVMCLNQRNLPHCARTYTTSLLLYNHTALTSAHTNRLNLSSSHLTHSSSHGRTRQRPQDQGIIRLVACASIMPGCLSVKLASTGV
jgi:hypothetical protein